MKKKHFVAAFLGAVIPLVGGLQAGENYTYQSSKEVVLEEPVEDPWEVSLAVYGLLPWVDLTLSGGTAIALDPGNVWDALNMTAQFEAEIRKGKWGISADVIYVDLGFSPDVKVIKNIRLKEWVIMPRVSYRAWEGNWGFLDLQAGIRSTSIDLTVTGDLPSIAAGSVLPGGPGLKGGSFSKSGYAQITDGSVGVRGSYNINDRWYFDYYGEVGAGDSDFIAQAFGAVGYHINSNADVFFGFRYLYYDFASGFPLDDETAYGPEVGVKVRF